MEERKTMGWIVRGESRVECLWFNKPHQDNMYKEGPRGGQRTCE